MGLCRVFFSRFGLESPCKFLTPKLAKCLGLKNRFSAFRGKLCPFFSRNFPLFRVFLRAWCGKTHNNTAHQHLQPSTPHNANCSCRPSTDLQIRHFDAKTNFWFFVIQSVQNAIQKVSVKLNPKLVFVTIGQFHSNFFRSIVIQH